MSNKINTVLFDLDGTLLDTAADITTAINHTLKQYQRDPVNADSFRRTISYGSAMMIKHAFDIDPEHAEYTSIRQRMIHHYQNNIAQQTQLFPGVQALIEYIDTAGYQWGIITNKPEDLSKQLLSHFDFHKTCRFVIGGDTLTERKPEPMQLLHACQLLDIKPHHAVYVGDSESDILAAKAAKMASIAVSYGYYPEYTQPQDWQADLVVDHPEQIIAWLKNTTEETQ